MLGERPAVRLCFHDHRIHNNIIGCPCGSNQTEASSAFIYLSHGAPGAFVLNRDDR